MSFIIGKILAEKAIEKKLREAGLLNKLYDANLDGIPDNADAVDTYHLADIQADAQSRIDSHAAATSGVHGVGTSQVESVAGAQAKVDNHAAAVSGIHGVGTGYIAKTSRSDQLPSWGDIPDKPATFPPSAHTHTISELTDHNKANHDALGINADTLDGYHATDIAGFKKVFESQDTDGYRLPRLSPNLDINQHKEYLIIANLLNADPSNEQTFKLMVESDNIWSNYYSQILTVEGSTITASSVNDSIFAKAAANTSIIVVAWVKLAIHPSGNGYALVCISECNKTVYSAGGGYMKSVITTGYNWTNITNLAIYNSVGYIGSLSKIEIYGRIG